MSAMFGPTVRFQSKSRLELCGTPLWVPAMLLAICAFSIGLAWLFFQSGTLWSEIGMTRMLNPTSTSGRYVASWPFALMTLVLGLPWLLALTQVSLRGVVIDAAAGHVLIRPIGVVRWREHHVSVAEISGTEIEQARAPMLRRMTGRVRNTARPILRLTTGETIPLVGRPLEERHATRILHMARKVLTHVQAGR